MHEITGNRDAVRDLLKDTVQHLVAGGTKATKPVARGAAMSKRQSQAKAADQIAERFNEALAQIEGRKGMEGAGLRRIRATGERATLTGYAPRNQVIAVFQSAMDEYLDQVVGASAGRAAATRARASAASIRKKVVIKPTNAVATLDNFYQSRTSHRKGTIARPANIFAQYSNLDPHWVDVVTEKAKCLLDGKHYFISHSKPTDFHFGMGEKATVAIVGDWGGGNAPAQAIAKQIRALEPTHVIHLGDVYYAGTPEEVKSRFLKFWPTPQEPGYSFALNSNHEMYGGGYGYFDHTLKQFKQPASYFSLANDNWRFIGLDTGYEDHTLNGPQLDWLRTQFVEKGPRTILLTHHQLFSAYEDTDTSNLHNKIGPFLNQVYAWVWGHEHLAVVYEKHEGIKAICLGNGCFPYNLPRIREKVPVRWIESSVSDDPDYRGGHTFALFRLNGPSIQIEFINEAGQCSHKEVWQ